MGRIFMGRYGCAAGQGPGDPQTVPWALKRELPLSRQLPKGMKI